MKIRYFVILGFLIIFASTVVAVIEEVQYPVKELGNCESEKDCRAYCDEPENTEDCLDFARKNRLMSEEEVEMAEKFLQTEGKPGDCESDEECQAYCNNIDHIDECIAFAEENNLIPPEELEEAKKVQAAVRRGVKPPPCGNKKQCDIYCEEPEHMEECIAFGLEAGFIQGKEAEDVQKMLQAIKRGVKPPPCNGKSACDEYCSSSDNMEICMNFALEAGFMSEQEKADSQKMLAALKKGIKPPNCRGKEKCDVYCGQEEHFEECMNFAEAAGFMNSEEALMARKTGGRSPGNCKGKEECEAFCNNPDNQETCFNFSREYGLIPEEDLKMMEEGKQKFQESLNQAPPEVIDCLNSSLGSDTMEKFKSGSAMPPREIGDQMRECFQKMGPLPGPGQNKENMQPGQFGPRDCQTPEECQKFQPGPGETNPAGQIMPPQAGPGGCKGPEECSAFCENNPEQCKDFQSSESQMPPNQPFPIQKQPCQGEECQQYQQYGPQEGTQQQFQLPPLFKEGPIQQMPPPDQNIAPPPPQPTSFLINPDSLVASAVRALFSFLFNR